ncbi:MAG: Alpha/Beta hydrolase protein [Benjaminiella poitrasii]|nr:MAG: Alpha/Beta hydrolase protein [Benjaminiella poitrasii]
MESIRKLIKENIPSSIMMRIIQSFLSLPPVISRYLIADFTAPTRTQKRWIKMIQQPHWRGAWIGPSLSLCENEEYLQTRIREADLIIFEVHGGAFRVGHCTMYMDVFMNWIHLLKDTHNINTLILSVEYSLAPEHKYPTPVLECVAAYEYLTTTLKIPGSKIILSGDSAGGALCLETLIRVYAPNILNDLNAPRTNYSIDLPAGLFLVSPLVSANTSSWLWQYKEDLVTPLLASQVLKDYLNLPGATNLNELHVLKLTQIASGFDRFAPSHALAYVGDREVMRDDILSLVNTINQEVQSRVRVEVRRENYEHDWYFIREIVKAEDRDMLVQADLQFVAYAARCCRPEPSTSCSLPIDKEVSIVVNEEDIIDKLDISDLKSEHQETASIHFTKSTAEFENEATIIPTIIA